LILNDYGRGLYTTEGKESWQIVDGIVDFVEKQGKDYFGEKVRKEKWVEQNWNAAEINYKSHQWYRELGKKIADAGGIILEVAIGPGGGNMPPILLSKSDASIILNDLSLMVLQDWKNLFEKKGIGKHVSFAAFDACRIPLRSASINVVSSGGGICNISGYSRAVKEIYRVLKLGGYLFSVEPIVDPDDWLLLPKNFRFEWELQFPTIIDGFAKVFAESGFEIISSETVLHRDLDPRESDLARAVDRLGVKLRILLTLVQAMKPRSFIG